MPEPAVVAAMREFKAGLLRRDAAQMERMARRWVGVEAALDDGIVALSERIARRRDDGEPVSDRAVQGLARYKRLRAQVGAEFEQYAAWAGEEIGREQATLAELGIEQAAQAIQLSGYERGMRIDFDRLPVEAVESMVGRARNGAPLGDLLKQRMVQESGAWERLTQELVDGTALGRNPRAVARSMRDSLTGGLQKALVIARTEGLEVYRQASVEQYRSSGVVSGQKRLSAHDMRVCPACIADDGALYSLDATIADHPQGRCTSVPVVDGMPEVEWPSGEEWFRNQPRETQESILGPGRMDAWEAGEFEFGDLATATYDDVWGAGIVPTSLGDLVEGGGEDDGLWLDDDDDDGGGDIGPRPVTESEWRAEEDLAEAREAYEAMLAAGDEAGAAGIKSYMDTLEQSLEQERGANAALWEHLGMTPGEAGAADWRLAAEGLERESRDLYKKYTQEGIGQYVAEKRGAQWDGWMHVGKEHIRVRRGRFSRRQAQRMEAELWGEAKDDLAGVAGEYLERLGFAADEIAEAGYAQRLRLLEEIGGKEILRTASGRVSRIDAVSASVRRRVVEAVDWDAAATCANAALDPLSLPGLDAYEKRALAEYIMQTQGG